MAGSRIALAAVLLLAGCAGRGEQTAPPKGWRPGAAEALAAAMGPAARRIADRNLPDVRREDLYDRTTGWASFDLGELPTLGLSDLTGADAERVNALRTATAAAEPMKPFVFRGSAADRAQALKCLTQAVYYEAASEPLSGQQAVAQTVINRLRHPGYPKSICGVVFEGAMRTTGCQFTFTCDGSLARAPAPGQWKQAQGVAKAAMGGFVDRQVGTATHYHASYVTPYWAPTLLKIAQVGAHIFYRWTGPQGEPQAFTGRYAGGERNLTPAILQGIDERIQGQALVPTMAPRKVTLALAGEEARTYTVAEAVKPGQAPGAGTLVASRRAPTKDEVKEINDKLKAIEAAQPRAAPESAPLPASGFTTDLPIGTAPKP